jgi:DNA polymerase-1
LEKLRGTYIDALPALVNPQTGRLHTSFSQTGAVTGRLSSSNPNLQNIPIRTDIGREIRRAIVAPSGWQLISADYSQVELRVLAHMAARSRADRSLPRRPRHSRRHGVEALWRADCGSHAHAARAGQDDQLRHHLRRQRLWPQQPHRTDARAGASISRTVFSELPKHSRFLDRTLEQARATGYVQTLLGRKRFFPELQSGRLPFNQRAAVERAAINAPIQGTAADIMKIAMIRLHARLREDGYRTRLLLQVHDELVLETPPEEQDAVVTLVRDTMSTAYELVVPLKVDVEVGPNWRDLTNA